MPEEQSFIPGLAPPQAEQAAQPDILGSALSAGKWGALGGGALGGLRGLMRGKGFLKNTLGGALLGALGAGGFTAFHKADPFQRGGMAGTAYQEAMQRALGEAVGGGTLSDVGSGALQQALMSVLSGKGQFTPDQQQALVQQFTQSLLPTEKGWGKRIKLGEQVSHLLSSNRPQRAYGGLRAMSKVMPDMDMRTAIQHAMQRIEAGRIRSPEERSALAALGSRMKSRLEMYRKATPAIGALGELKSQFGAGGLSSEDLAKRVGLLTGRFGAKDEKSQRMRQFLQETIARPAATRQPGNLLGSTMREAPALGDYVMSALER